MQAVALDAAGGGEIRRMSQSSRAGFPRRLLGGEAQLHIDVIRLKPRLFQIHVAHFGAMLGL